MFWGFFVCCCIQIAEGTTLSLFTLLFCYFLFSVISALNYYSNNKCVRKNNIQLTVLAKCDFDLLLTITELSVALHIEVKSFVIGYAWILLSNQRSAPCYQEAARNYPVVLLLNSAVISAVESSSNPTIK